MTTARAGIARENGVVKSGVHISRIVDNEICRL